MTDKVEEPNSEKLPTIQEGTETEIEKGDQDHSAKGITLLLKYNTLSKYFFSTTH